jgi:5-methylcytosine-specific restriction enzyme subunit McrC
MPACRTVLEHGLLFRASASCPEDENRIPPADFDALRALIVDASQDEEEAEEDGTISYERLFRLRNAGKELALQVRNFVGVIETPSGLQIEILPKIGGNPEKARELLVRMLRIARRIPPIAAHQASLRSVGLPLTEFFAKEFLTTVNHLLKRGLLSGYERRERNDRFFKGRLLIAKHLRQNLVRADRFYVEHDQFQLSRAENRLLRSALEVVATISKDTANQKLCRELLFALDDVPASTNVSDDLERCVKDRSLSHYTDALMWAQLILLRLRPLGSGGKARVRALLFPMERLFEEYVGAGLRKHFRHPAKVRPQAGTKSLVTHKNVPYFRLRPDYVVEIAGEPKFVVDAKWKLINAALSGTDKKYGLAQSDLYQLYAYGNKYLTHGDEKKTLVLAYPRTDAFSEPLAPFAYEPDHVLHVVPFDLERCELVGVESLLTV